MNRQRIPSLLGLITVFLICTNASLPADVVLIDDDFSSGTGYTFVSYFNNATIPVMNTADESYADYEIETSGGNTDDAMNLMHFHNVERDENTGDPINGNGATRLFSFLRNDAVNYNPQSQGAFETVTFSFDYNTSETDFESVFAHMRNGSGQGNFAGRDTSVITDGNWHSFSQTFTNADFFLMDFSGATNTSFEFGFGFESSRDVTDDSDEVALSVYVDNFQVVLSSVPEPSSLGILGTIGIAAAIRRRKRT